MNTMDGFGWKKMILITSGSIPIALVGSGQLFQVHVSFRGFIPYPMDGFITSEALMSHDGFIP